MNTQTRNNRFVSECLRCAFAEQDAGPPVLRAINQPRANHVTVADAMVQRFTQLGVTVPEPSFFGHPVKEVLAVLTPNTPPTAPAAANQAKAHRTFVMPARSALPRAA